MAKEASSQTTTPALANRGSLYHDGHADKRIQFTGWTGSTNGTFAVVHERPNGAVRNVGSLDMQANFVDTNTPFLSITNIPAGFAGKQRELHGHGCCDGQRSGGQRAVFAQRGSFRAGHVNREGAGTPPLALLAGNQYFCGLRDGSAGNISATNTASIDYVETSMLTVRCQWQRKHRPQL